MQKTLYKADGYLKQFYNGFQLFTDDAKLIKVDRAILAVICCDKGPQLVCQHFGFHDRQFQRISDLYT